MTRPVEKAASAFSIAGMSASYFRTRATSASDKVGIIDASPYAKSVSLGAYFTRSPDALCSRHDFGSFAPVHSIENLTCSCYVLKLSFLNDEMEAPDFPCVLSTTTMA